MKVLKQHSRHTRFSVDVLVNEHIRSRGWLELLAQGMKVGELLEEIATSYDLDEYVAERLELVYDTYTRAGRKQIQSFDEDVFLTQLGVRTNEKGEQVTIDLTKDVRLEVLARPGDEVEEDCSCDSTYMLDVMPHVAIALREAFHWVSATETIYLVMDNAGGHGTNESIVEYTNILSQRNIQIIWQIPRSPETNMLDLGVWMSVQSAVIKAHRNRRCHPDALAKSITEAWEHGLSTKAFDNVFGRLKVVLRCILDDNGGNTLVESKRGKLFQDATIPNDFDVETATMAHQPLEIVDISDEDSVATNSSL